MNRDISVTRTVKAQKEKKGKANVYTLARTDVFEAQGIDDLTEMHFVAQIDRDNTLRNIDSLQKHLVAIEDELLQIQSLIDMARKDEGVAP